jgi:hypothetical protein
VVWEGCVGASSGHTRPMAEVVGDRRYEPARAGQPLALDGFGYRWLRLPG